MQSTRTRSRSKGMHLVAETQTTSSMQVSRASSHTGSISEYCIGRNLRGLRPSSGNHKALGNRRTWSSGMGRIVLTGRGRRTSQRSVNAKAGVGLSLPRARRGKRIRSVSTPKCVARPQGNSLGWSVMSAEFQAMGSFAINQIRDSDSRREVHSRTWRERAGTSGSFKQQVERHPGAEEPPSWSQFSDAQPGRRRRQSVDYQANEYLTHICVPNQRGREG